MKDLNTDQIYLPPIVECKFDQRLLGVNEVDGRHEKPFWTRIQFRLKDNTYIRKSKLESLPVKEYYRTTM